MFDQWDDDKLDELEEHALDNDHRDKLVSDARDHREHLTRHTSRDVIDIICDMIAAGRREEAVAVLAKECGFEPVDGDESFDITVNPGMVGHCTRSSGEFIVKNHMARKIRLRGRFIRE